MEIIMERFLMYINKLKSNPVYFCILTVVLGIVLLFFPGITLNVLCNIFGTLITIKGILTLIEYWKYRHTATSSNKLIIGILELIAGFNFVMISYLLIQIISSVLGVFIMYKGSKQFSNAMESKKYYNRSWIWMLVLSVITIILGFAMIFLKLFLPNLIIKAIGICLIYTGITSFIISNHINKEESTLIDDDEV